LAEHARFEIGDEKIGELLSRAPEGEDGVWPCLPVCEAMERIRVSGDSPGASESASSTDVEWNFGEGGAQERERSSRYRGLAQRLAFEYPYVSNVLETIAVSYDREGRVARFQREGKETPEPVTPENDVNELLGWRGGCQPRL